MWNNKLSDSQKDLIAMQYDPRAKIEIKNDNVGAVLWYFNRVVPSSQLNKKPINLLTVASKTNNIFWSSNCYFNSPLWDHFLPFLCVWHPSYQQRSLYIILSWIEVFLLRFSYQNTEEILLLRIFSTNFHQ